MLQKYYSLLFWDDCNTATCESRLLLDNKNFRYPSKNHIKPDIKTRSNSKIRPTSYNLSLHQKIKEYFFGLFKGFRLYLKIR